MRHLITGGHGFIGSNLARYIKSIEPTSEVIKIGREHDLTNSILCDQLFNSYGKFDYIYHLADVNGNAKWVANNALEVYLLNLQITLNVIRSVSTFQAKTRLIGFNSLWAYPEKISTASEMAYWDGALNSDTAHYGINKKTFVIGLETLKKYKEIGGTMLTLGSVYGPGDNSDHIIPTLMKKMKDQVKSIEIWGDGSQLRDFTYIDDQVKAIYLHKDYNGQILNISSGVNYSISDLVSKLKILTNFTGEIIFNKNNKTYRDIRIMSVHEAFSYSGWPESFKLHSLDDGLKLTLTQEINNV